MPSNYYVAFWNLENLFDVQNSPRRGEKLERAIGKDLVAWDQARLDRKIAQLASVINRMNNGAGPDLLGVCEVENDFVMEQLVAALTVPGRSYKIEHADTEDRRGIDVGFIYDETLFRPEATFNHFVLRRTATRDILQVNFRTHRNRLFVAVANHWPSRSGGELKSAGYRQIAGETLAYFHQRILQVHGDDTPVLAMGDFNDEPFNRSLTDYALAIESRTKVINSQIARFLNLMWLNKGKALGTFYFDNYPNMLDQFLANKQMLTQNAPIRVDVASAEIITFPDMVNTGDYPKPINYGGIGSTEKKRRVNPDGFSDHFPIAVRVTEDN